MLLRNTCDLTFLTHTALLCRRV